MQSGRPRARPRRGLLAAAGPRRPEAALAAAWAAGIPLAALWVALTALDGRTYHLAPALVAAAPGVAARLLGLSVVGGGFVAAGLVLAGVLAAFGAWGVIELAGLATTATLWPGLPGGVRGEIAGAVVLGALAGLIAIAGGRERPRT